MTIPGFFTLIVATFFLAVACLNLIWIGRLFDPPRRAVFRLIFLAATASTLVGFNVIRSFWRNSDAMFFLPILYAASFWMVLQIILLPAWPATALLVWWRKRQDAKNSSTIQPSSLASQEASQFSRRDFLRRSAFLPPALALGVNTSGFIEADRRMVCRYADIVDSRWPATLDGMKIAHLTDLHLGPFISIGDLQKALSLLADSKPDLLAITGDFCDKLSLLNAVEPLLRNFVRTLPLGAYFCMGNHEQLRGVDAFLDFMPRAGVRVLMNEKVTLRRGNASFSLAGLDHPAAQGAEREEQMARNFEQLIGSTVTKEYMVLLCHHPAYVEPAAQRNVPLTLLGHTHGGQVSFLGRTLGEVFTPYSRGLYHIGESRVYVSSGAGHWFPFRFNCPPEVNVLRMRSQTI